MSRDKCEREQDRADLLAVLVEAGGGPLRTDTLIARANGMADPSYTDRAWWRHYSRGMSDLRALVRLGKVLQVREPGQYSGYVRWQLATDADVDAESDACEVERMLSRWEPAS